MGIFRFKQFSVRDDVSAMKVNTDAVLLGAVMTLSENDNNLLDIGTGTGIIALMVAQRISSLLHSSGRIDASEYVKSYDRPSYSIDAIDIDSGTALEASENFSASIWKEHLNSIHSSLEDYSKSLESDSSKRIAFHGQTQPLSRLNSDRFYDVIFSNPPYFDLSLHSPDSRRATARNSDMGLSYREIVDFSSKFLSPGGRLSMILPSSEEKELLRYANAIGLHLFRIVRIRSVAHKTPFRIIAELSFSQNDSPEEIDLTINCDNGYTPQYTEFVKDFYLYM